MSKEKIDLRLCGGVFFELILKARKQRIKARETISGSSDGLSNTNCLKSLIRIFNPEYIEPVQSTFKQNTSQYKKCAMSKGTYLPFAEKTIIDNFDKGIKVSYSDYLDRMYSFVMDYLDTEGKARVLCEELLSLIEADTSILKEQEFYCLSDGDVIRKNELLTCNSICFEAFLLGIWHFILINRSDNLVGKTTIAVLSEQGSIHNIYPNVWNIKIQTVGKSNVPSNNISKALSVPSIYTEYLEKVQNKFKNAKTYLHSDKLQSFYEVYVCNTVAESSNLPGVRGSWYTSCEIENVNVNKLISRSNYLVISGTGGLGKSMMMVHLLLDSIKNYDKYQLIPVFISLKDYEIKYDNLLDFIYSRFSIFAKDISLKEFASALEAGDCLLLLDGLDEISTSSRNHFERALEAFSDMYDNSYYIISSRPYTAFDSLSRYSVLNLQPFTKKQALMLIDKLEFRTDEPQIKEKFRENLDKSFYEKHKEFTTNPLLLTIMLQTFEDCGEIPSKMHLFYNAAYWALAKKHDANRGYYNRTLWTGLSADRFSDYFSEFCARTYMDEKCEFTDNDISRYFGELNEKNKEQNDDRITATNFLKDLTTNLCLMYYESNKYYFSHDSFQEYFCALFFTRTKDKMLENIGKAFEKRRIRTPDDKTFLMLYDMIQPKIEEYVFIPFLDDIFSECESENKYWTYIKRMYPFIESKAGEIELITKNEPDSFIISFISKIKGFSEKKKKIGLPYHAEFIAEEYAYIIAEEGALNLIDTSQIGTEALKDYPDLEIVGTRLRYDTKELFLKSEKYQDVLACMESDVFPIKEEFCGLQKFRDDLHERYRDTDSDLDIFKL